MKKLIKPAKPCLDQNLTPDLLGQVIKTRRIESGFTLEAAAALCGVAKQTFMKIEHGNPSSQLKSILQICHGLGIKIHIAPWINAKESDNDWV